MRYLSLFSGIGGFEVAIHQVYGDKAVCVGYSEIDKHAIAEYERHYPNHFNLGDITKVKKKDIDRLGRIDLIVGGFPCNDLSSAGHFGRLGLDGKQSGLFWTMLKIIKWARKNNPDLKIIIENNASMAHKWRDMITAELSTIMRTKVFCNYFDSNQWLLQRRRRYYWTLNLIPEYTRSRQQTFKRLLSPTSKVLHLQLDNEIAKKKNECYGEGNSGIIWIDTSHAFKLCAYQTRWKSSVSFISNNYVKCITTVKNDNILLDTRFSPPILRCFSKAELNRLFGLPANFVQSNVASIYQKLYGMCVVPCVVVHILQNLD